MTILISLLKISTDRKRGGEKRKIVSKLKKRNRNASGINKKE